MIQPKTIKVNRIYLSDRSPVYHKKVREPDSQPKTFERVKAVFDNHKDQTGYGIYSEIQKEQLAEEKIERRRFR